MADESDWRPRIWPGWLTKCELPSGDRLTVWTCSYDVDDAMSEKRKYDSTIARIAGNIAGHLLDRVLVVRLMGDYVGFSPETINAVASQAVLMARAIVADIERTEPKADA